MATVGSGAKGVAITQPNEHVYFDLWWRKWIAQTHADRVSDSQTSTSVPLAESGTGNMLESEAGSGDTARPRPNGTTNRNNDKF